MAENFKSNRDNFYNIIKSGNPNYSRSTFDMSFQSQVVFDTFANGIISKRSKSTKDSYWRNIKEVSLDQYYQKYACDQDWAKGHRYCGGNEPTPTPTTVDDNELKKLIGIYESDQTSDGKFRIFDATSTSVPDSKFQLGIMSYTYSYVSGLLTDSQKSGDEIISKLSIDASHLSMMSSYFPTTDLSILKITFSKDRQSFTYDIFGHSGIATKTEEKKVEKKKTDDKKTDNNKPNGKVEKPYKPHQTTLYDNEINYDKIEDDELKKLKNCGSIDFPFELYCQNKIIGDLNEKLFRSRRNDMYTELLQNYLTSLTLFGQDNLGKLLTRNVWDQAMKMRTIKESVKKVLKEYINKKK